MRANDPLVLLQAFVKNCDPELVGEVFRSYISESNHQGWDGYSRQDMTGIRNFATDFQLYFNNYIDQRK